jgi:branched-chain amino acid transport system permease protein
MTPNRHRDLKLDWLSILLMLPWLVLPFLRIGPYYSSLLYQIAIGVAASMAIYIMLRMGLLAFTVPAFMAIGGYAAAMLAKWGGIRELPVLLSAAFIVPVLFAIPLGALVLRLKGLYFIFITFIFNEILQLIIFETPDLTGGTDGIVGIPPVKFLGIDLGDPSRQVLVSVIVCIIAALTTLWVTQRYRAEFTSIEENETLAESLGVAVWKYRTIGFLISAGVSGLAGFALVNILGTAHPTSFTSWSVNNYIAYVFIGGRSTMLGVLVGSTLLIVMSNYFSAYAHLSAGLFGLLLIAVMMAAPGGLVGTFLWLFSRKSETGPSMPPAREVGGRT